MFRHRLLMPLLWHIMAGIVVAILASGVSLAGWQDDNAAPKKNYAQEYYQSFKGKPANADGLVLKGPDAQELVKYEPDGLRITLPTGHPDQRANTGLVLVSPVKGDFEITMRFEILKEPDPADAGKK